MSEKLISPSAQSVVKLKETRRGWWSVTYKDIVLHTPLPREEAANARMRIIRAMNLHSQECETIGEERSKREERGRIEARLQAKRNWDEAIAENGFEEGDSPHRVAANRIAVQVWDMAINIVNHTE